MNFHIPAEVFEGVLIFILTAVWKSYRSMWRHIARVEKRILMIMVMLRDRGFVVPNDSDTEIFTKSNNL